MTRKLLPLLLALSVLLSGCLGSYVPEGPTPSTVIATTEPAEPDLLTVHFLDVGQADCALLECGGQTMLIDGGNVADGSLVVAYLQNQEVASLDAVVCTHAHEDHVGGLPAVLAVYPVAAVYAPTRTYSSNCFDDFMYYVDQQELSVQIPVPGQQFSLGSAEVTVLGPVESYADTNNTSIILRVDYGDTAFLFTGDMETDAETDLLESGADLSADVLKVGHHGSSTSTGYRFLREVMPTYGVISVGTDNAYGHPHEEVLSRLEDAGVTTFRTDELGTIVAVSDGETITFTWENQNAQPQTAEQAETGYIGNVNSRKVHSPDCANLPKEENRIYFDSYEEAIAAGYTPCSSCLG